MDDRIGLIAKYVKHVKHVHNASNSRLRPLQVSLDRYHSLIHVRHRERRQL
jgi:hypothetical protein